MASPAFCQTCGRPLEIRNEADVARPYCSACHTFTYENPVPATAALVRNSTGDILLVQRAVEPGRGLWCLPGGFIEIGETPEQGMLRELEEETGLQGRILGLVGAELGSSPTHPAVLVLGYTLETTGGELQAGDDAAAVAYFPQRQLPAIAFASHRRLIEKLGCRQAALPAVFGAYVITSNDHVEIARQACRAGARILQYREKTASADTQLRTASEIRRITRAHGCLMIVNDRPDIALLAGADGVHLGQGDIPVARARSLAPSGFLIGVSTHSLEQALQAESQGSDYIGIGPVFATPTKENYPPIGLDTLRQVRDAVHLPVVAIGGINLQNMAQVKAAGARNVAMVREFQQDTASKVRAVNALFLAGAGIDSANPAILQSKKR